ncbi:hypothetical protein ABKV19_020205 [Rosa sericea]
MVYRNIFGSFCDYIGSILRYFWFFFWMFRQSSSAAEGKRCNPKSLEALHCDSSRGTAINICTSCKT